MHLRAALPADLPHCVTIDYLAYEANSNVLTNFLAPKRAEHELSWRYYALRVMRNKYYQPNVWTIVCVADESDDFADAGDILGYANWVRRGSHGDYEPRIPKKATTFDHLESWLSWAELWWEETLRINPAISWTNTDVFMQAVKKSSAFAPIRGSTHWFLNGLSVSPSYQRRGIARRLVIWGLNHAQVETMQQMAVGGASVPAALISTASAMPLYRSLGFKVMSWEDDSFLSVSTNSGSSMVWDAAGYWIQDIEFETPMKRGVIESVYKAALPQNAYAEQH